MHYHIYDEQGEAVSKTSFDENTPSLGRVNTLAVPPPHTIASLKNHLIKSENILGRDVQIFDDEDGESPMNDTDVIALLSDSFPGCMEHQPIAVTYEGQGASLSSQTQLQLVSKLHHELPCLSDGVQTDYLHEETQSNAGLG